ncbi:hypothetical protein [Paenibacillus montanisoli]|uniref:Uncharacterized protein n=1 Tax=Paenibacillus montanisoli TaxID=2081970 RepID=A0A328U595_9BACL|nr:hypothetical protein [Paenibacillus montanisoli]RAP77729.1 hypothetical protein DL346_04510 [Paenibacillus montanisoli]
MAHKKIGIITQRQSDFTDILAKTPTIQVQRIPTDEILNYDLDLFDALCILGGTEEVPLVLGAYERIKIEEQIDKGKKLFCEFCGSIADSFMLEPASTRFSRMVVAAKDETIPGLLEGDILDDQCNVHTKPLFANSQAAPLLVSKSFVNAHRHTKLEKADIQETVNWSLWFEKSNVLVAAFRLCNFNRARMAPMAKWHSLMTYILEWICEETVRIDVLEPPYHTVPFDPNKDFRAQLEASVTNAAAWFENADLLKQNGKHGIQEGLGTEIDPNGDQKRLTTVRTDCAGEAALFYYMHFLLTGDPASLERSDNLLTFCFEALQVKSGPFKGMIRWSEFAWGTCYQDDVARVLIPQLLKCLYGNTTEYLDECTQALKFLVDTTGTDGTRVSRTDLIDLDEENMKKLASEPGNLPSAHYNGFYFGALLLGWKLTGKEAFKAAGIKGLETLMSVYPETKREQSETQELCRLILPLAWLYWVTGEHVHRDWLYQVTEDLQKFKHSSGGYLEWDTGYKAACSRTENAECSLLAHNGDPVVDLLYSLNWLPLGFIQAYFVTGDPYFKQLWEEISQFMLTSQIHSGNKLIHGGWTRGFDVELMEVFGIPNDVGWGPWAMESGWTVAEIGTGLMAGLLADELSLHYLNSAS